MRKIILPLIVKKNILLLVIVLGFSKISIAQNFKFKYVLWDDELYTFKNGIMKVTDSTITWSAGKKKNNNPINHYKISESVRTENGITNKTKFRLHKEGASEDKKIKGQFIYDGKKYSLAIWVRDTFIEKTSTMIFELKLID
tara:strand:+ start:98 stop:523 length:426 start_codon:yes stop_codon:yes gene_type:complete